MINLLPESYRLSVSRADLIGLERNILMTLQYSVQWAGPIPFVDRYLRLLGLQECSQVAFMAKQFCKHTAKSADLCMGVSPSRIAVSCVLAAVNISLSKKVSALIGIDC